MLEKDTRDDNVEIIQVASGGGHVFFRMALFNLLQKAQGLAFSEKRLTTEVAIIQHGMGNRLSSALRSAV